MSSLLTFLERDLTRPSVKIVSTARTFKMAVVVVVASRCARGCKYHHQAVAIQAPQRHCG